MLIHPLIEKLYLTQALEPSPLRINSTFLSLSSDLLSSLAKDFKSILSSLHFDFIYPTELFSVPLASHLAFLTGAPLFLTSPIHTFMHPGQTALLVDASSSFTPRLESCIQELNKQKITTSDALILLGPTSEEEKTCKKLNIALHYLWDITDAKKDLNTLLH